MVAFSLLSIHLVMRRLIRRTFLLVKEKILIKDRPESGFVCAKLAFDVG